MWLAALGAAVTVFFVARAYRAETAGDQRAEEVLT
jgi:hypothetical protein